MADFIKREIVLIISILLLLVLVAISPLQKPSYYISFIDYKTIYTLFILMILTSAIKESNVIELIACNLASKAKNTRKLAIILISLSLLLSTFLTNDIALFIIIPLTISMKSYIKGYFKRIISLEAIAVNVGSSLTPIGNPQNILLWHKYNIPFLRFIISMLPLVIMMFALIIVFVILSIPSKDMKNIKKKDIDYNYTLFYISVILLILFVASVEIGLYIYSGVFIMLLYAIIWHRVFKSLDILLILLFSVLFVDFGLLLHTDLFASMIKLITTSDNTVVFFSSIVTSQLISNVPAAILLSHFVKNPLPLIYGVSIGGNGIIISSLANIIAIRLAGKRKIIYTFHKYSILYLVVSTLIGYFIFIAFFG